MEISSDLFPEFPSATKILSWKVVRNFFVRNFTQNVLCEKNLNKQYMCNCQNR